MLKQSTSHFSTLKYSSNLPLPTCGTEASLVTLVHYTNTYSQYKHVFILRQTGEHCDQIRLLFCFITFFF
jgi:hypothetical protein